MYNGLGAPLGDPQYTGRKTIYPHMVRKIGSRIQIFPRIEKETTNQTITLTSLGILEEENGNCKLKTKKPDQIVRLYVIPLGLEPRTHTLKVYCSTS